MVAADSRARRSAPVLEILEDRHLLSVSLVQPIALDSGSPTEVTSVLPIIVGSPIAGPTPISTPSPTPINQGGVTIYEKPGMPFTAVVGTFYTIAPGTNLMATINWGDGTPPSVGTITPVGVTGVDVIKFSVTGSHTYAAAGKFPIVTTVTQNLGPPSSLAPVRLIATIRSVAIVSAQTNLNLDGTITGTYSLAPTAITVGALYIFSGTGSAGVMGPVQASGKVELPSPIASTTVGHAIGSITLTSIGASPLPGGSVTLHVIGPAQTSSDPFPTTLNYVIASGTGAFAGATGSGTIDVLLDPTSQAFTFKIHSAA